MLWVSILKVNSQTKSKKIRERESIAWQRRAASEAAFLAAASSFAQDIEEEEDDKAVAILPLPEKALLVGEKESENACDLMNSGSECRNLGTALNQFIAISLFLLTR